MEKLICSLFVMVSLLACREKTDEAMLEKDRKVLEKSLETDNLFVYKLAKITLRRSAEANVDKPEYAAFRKKSNKLLSQINAVYRG